MSFFGKIAKAFKEPSRVFLYFKTCPVFRLMSDKSYLGLCFKASMKKKLNLSSPETYSDKLQWLKLYDRRPEYTQMVDKYEVKNLVAQAIGEEYLIPTIGVWDRYEDIDFDLLPDKFVLKCTHDSGGIYICRGKANFDAKACEKWIKSRLKQNYFWAWREWPYKDVTPRIIAEPYMEDAETGELRDYKFFCFDGEVRALFIATDRQSAERETCFDFFDENFNHLDLRQGHPNAKVQPLPPKNFELMKQLAKKLSAGIPHVRVDFYEVNGQVLFGEITFYHFSGMMPFEPECWDKVFGDWITLPQTVGDK